VSEKRRKANRRAQGRKGPVAPSSFIRTMTVGSGIGPDLLTPDGKAGALAGSCLRTYRRWGIAPRPEDVCVPANRPAKCNSPG